MIAKKFAFFKCTSRIFSFCVCLFSVWIFFLFLYLTSFDMYLYCSRYSMNVAVVDTIP